MADQPSEQEIAEAAAEIAAVSAVLAAGAEAGQVYVSSERGPERIEGPDGLNPVHAERALRAVHEGRREASPAAQRALKRQSETEFHTHR
jgi:hypothetical protein